MTTYTLDAKRLICPMPVIRTQKRMKDLLPGDRLTVECTDPGVIHDIPAWCRMYGHTVSSIEELDDEIHIHVEKGHDTE